MKYLEEPQFEDLNNFMSCINLGEVRLFGRVEVYSCMFLLTRGKNTDADLKLKNYLKRKFPSEEGDELVIGSHHSARSLNNSSLSPLNQMSPRDEFRERTSRKTFFLLLATLNAAFPDYDFSDLNPETFVKIPFFTSILNQVNAMTVNLQNEQFSELMSLVWQAIDKCITFSESSLYSFVPDPDQSPDAEEGNLWSFYYFFFNKKLKKMVFFTFRCVNALAPRQPEEERLDSRDQTPFDEHTMHSMEM